MSVRTLRFFHFCVPSSIATDVYALKDINDHLIDFFFCSPLRFDFFDINWEKPGNS